MAQPASFDITSTVDLQEVDNAVNQARKEIAQRYDFKGSRAVVTADCCYSGGIADLAGGRNRFLVVRAVTPSRTAFQSADASTRCEDICPLAGVILKSC